MLSGGGDRYPPGSPQQGLLNSCPIQRSRRLGDDVFRHRDSDQLLAALHRCGGGAERFYKHRLIGREAFDEFHPGFFRGEDILFQPDEPGNSGCMGRRISHNNLFLPFGVCQVFVPFRNILRFDKLLVINQGDIFNTENLNLIVLFCPFGIDGGRR